MKIKNIFEKVHNGDQFIIHAISGFTYSEKDFAITESTPNLDKNKIITIDFGEGGVRSISTDWILFILKEFYGKDYLIQALNEFKSYDEIKDKDIQTK